MQYTTVDYVSTLQKSKYARFKTSHLADNISAQLGVNNSLGKKITINAGDTGLIYEVRGATMFIGFNKDFKVPPSKFSGPTAFAACIQLYINDIGKIEIEP